MNNERNLDEVNLRMPCESEHGESLDKTPRKWPYGLLQRKRSQRLFNSVLPRTGTQYCDNTLLTRDSKYLEPWWRIRSNLGKPRESIEFPSQGSYPKPCPSAAMLVRSLGEPLPRVYWIQHINFEIKPQNVLGLNEDQPRQQFWSILSMYVCDKLMVRKCRENELLSSLVMLEPKQKPSQTKWPGGEVLQWHIKSHAPASPNNTSARSAHRDTGQQPESGLQVKKDQTARGKTFKSCETYRDLAQELLTVSDLRPHLPSTNAQGVATPWLKHGRCRLLKAHGKRQKSGFAVT